MNCRRAIGRALEHMGWMGLDWIGGWRQGVGTYWICKFNCLSVSSRAAGNRNTILMEAMDYTTRSCSSKYVPESMIHNNEIEFGNDCLYSNIATQCNYSWKFYNTLPRTLRPPLLIFLSTNPVNFWNTVNLLWIFTSYIESAQSNERQLRKHRER